MTDKKILILDNLPKSFTSKLITFIKVFIKEGILLKQWHYIFKSPSKGGSIEIPRNLIKSLHEFRSFSFDYNKYDEDRFYDLVCVIKDPNALRWAISQKKKGKIKKILAGPFISTLPSDNHFLLEEPEIDSLVFFCEWHRNIFFNLYKRKNMPSYIWFAGVDTSRWKPETNTKRDTILIYKKWPNKSLISHIEKTLIKHNLKFEIINCGFYEPEEYKSKLNSANCAIFIAHSETQGLAIFEAWSMNIPTIHWDPGFMDYYGKHFDNSSSAPYLTNELGKKFKNEEDFEQKFLEFYKEICNYNTRTIMENKYSLEKSAILFTSIIKDLL